MTLYRAPGGDLLRFAGLADFAVARDRIGVRLPPKPDLAAVEACLLGAVMSFWLERRGRPALHASAVEVDGRAVAFLAGNRGGKTSLCAALMAAGHALLTDDILAVEREPDGLRGAPGYPSLRMWPDAAGFFLGGSSGLERVHPGTEKLRVPVGEGDFGEFRDLALPLAAVYLPERVPSRPGVGVSIEPVSRADAVVGLVGRSFSPRIAEAAGLQPARLGCFAELVRRVPVRRLVFPSGLERLEEVRSSVCRDVAARLR